MTREYLRGEVLLLLARMQDAAVCADDDRAVAALRREAESVPVDDLAAVLGCALDEAEAWCREALAADDTASFRLRRSVAADLHDFGACSGLLTSKDPD